MLKMVKVRKQSVTFCKVVIASLCWLAVILYNPIPVIIVLAIAAVSAATGVDRAPLVRLYDITFARAFHTDEEYINLYSMRFAHLVAVSFCLLILLFYYFISPLFTLILTIVLGIMQSSAAFGFCSAAKLYDCVICNSSCCRIGKGIKGIRKNAR